MAAAYDHSDHNAPAIRHCDVIAYYRSFVSCSCVRIRSGVFHVGLPWLRPTQEKLWKLRVRGICDNDDVIRGRRRLFPTRDVIDTGWEEEEKKGGWKERRGRMMDVYSYYLQSQFAMEHSCRLKPLGDAVFRGPLVYLDGCQEKLYHFCYHCDMVQLKGPRLRAGDPLLARDPPDPRLSLALARVLAVAVVVVATDEEDGLRRRVSSSRHLSSRVASRECYLCHGYTTRDLTAPPDEVSSSRILITWFQISEKPLNNLGKNQGYVLWGHQDIRLVLFLYFRTESLTRFSFLLLLHIEEKKTNNGPCKEFSFGIWKKNRPFVCIILS
ncbi:hypothetical protein ALC57_09678 [Trachymyrmex cornetzi]|uniref:Uncharacterized protein n=1 Tax=Trachymyrmex cornetzi TaxID=471704 RepID=A0A195DYT7_9HYME|nr:hypothetical protein ALC57_09678 [Trachymyrmex cornetzi]